MADGGGARPALVPAQQNKRGILDLLESDRVRKGLAAVAGKHMNPERMTRLIINAINRTPDLLKCDPRTVLGATMTTTALALEPNTPQQLAWLLPYKTRRKVGDNEWEDYYECQFQIGAQGWKELMYRSPGITRVNAGAIYEHDRFVFKDAADIVFEYEPNYLVDDPGRIVAGYAYAKLETERGVDLIPTVVPWKEIEKIRSRSETYRALLRGIDNARNQEQRQKAERKLAETPWVMWEDQMVEKSCTKRLRKKVPITPQIAAAAAIDDGADVGQIDFSQMTDPDLVRAVASGEAEAPLIEHGEDQPMNNDIGAEQQREPAPAQQQAAASREPKPNARRADTPPAEDAVPDLPPDDATDTGSLFSE